MLFGGHKHFQCFWKEQWRTGYTTGYEYGLPYSPASRLVTCFPINRTPCQYINSASILLKDLERLSTEI